MVFVSPIEETRSLIFDGPVIGKDANLEILTTSDLSSVEGAHEFEQLSAKELEVAALRRNADDALDRITFHIQNAGQRIRILDVGSGFGFFLDGAKARGWDTVGLEPLPASAAYARAKFGLQVICDVLRYDTFPENSFDVVTAFQVFEHLPYPLEYLQVIHRMLRAGGIVLVEVPNIDNWTVKLARSRHRHFVEDHLNFFCDRTLSELFARAGFEVIGSYWPARRMTMGHLGGYWGRQYLPKMFHESLARILAKGHFAERQVSVKLGDIVAVLARKPVNASHSDI